ncbi:MAG: PHP domain-containing protein [Dehalococcoidales bacterium]|nr:PHP domain-containing protein [Dehalococcoidales bacterium]
MSDRTYKADLHIHSHFSKDSIMSPKTILKTAHKKKLDIIAITDHDTIKGGIEAKKYESMYGVKVIIGSEIKTDKGDIIGLKLTKDIKSRQYESVISEIKEQKGVVVFPHPFRGHKDIDRIAFLSDYIEVFNSRCTAAQNTKADELATSLGKTKLNNSDAHTIFEIGNAYNLVDADLRIVSINNSNRYTSTICIYSCQIIGYLRKRQFLKLAKLLCYAIVKKLRHR